MFIKTQLKKGYLLCPYDFQKKKTFEMAVPNYVTMLNLFCTYCMVWCQLFYDIEIKSREKKNGNNALNKKKTINDIYSHDPVVYWECI